MSPPTRIEPPLWFGQSRHVEPFRAAVNRAVWGQVYIAPGLVPDAPSDPGPIVAAVATRGSFYQGDVIPATAVLSILSPTGTVLFEGVLPDVLARLDRSHHGAPFLGSTGAPVWWLGYSGCWAG